MKSPARGSLLLFSCRGFLYIIGLTCKVFSNDDYCWMLISLFVSSQSSTDGSKLIGVKIG